MPAGPSFLLLAYIGIITYYMSHAAKEHGGLRKTGPISKSRAMKKKAPVMKG